MPKHAGRHVICVADQPAFFRIISKLQVQTHLFWAKISRHNFALFELKLGSVQSKLLSAERVTLPSDNNVISIRISNKNDEIRSYCHVLRGSVTNKRSRLGLARNLFASVEITTAQITVPGNNWCPRSGIIFSVSSCGSF